MDWPSILLLAFGLAMDAAAVSLGVAAGGQVAGARPVFRLSFHFGLFQGLMTLLGWLAGTGIAHLISSFDHVLATGLLLAIGARMIYSGVVKHDPAGRVDPSRGLSLVALSLATSIDALSAGISLAMLSVPILGASGCIGLVTAGLSLTALLLGQRLGKAFGHQMEILGGVILIAIGVRLFISHLA